MPHWNNQPWQRNLNKKASGKTGAVHPFINGAPDQGNIRCLRTAHQKPRVGSGVLRLLAFALFLMKPITRAQPGKRDHDSCLKINAVRDGLSKSRGEKLGGLSAGAGGRGQCRRACLRSTPDLERRSNELGPLRANWNHLALRRMLRRIGRGEDGFHL